ncbi:Os02g0638200, partial [Oryza sativa Japonica Group]
DFDQNTNSYATQLLEDIQSYHQQQNTTSVAATAATLPSFSLPACVSKACSILDAVADLNSSSSDSHSCEPDRSANDRGSVNAPLGGGMDDLAEPGVHKRHATAPRGDIRGGGGETEPQESAGSNSVSGNPWTPSWEPNSVESTDRTWSASRSTNNGDEVVEQGSSSHAGARSPLNRSRQSSKQRAAQPEHSVRSRAGSSGGNSNNVVHRGRGAHRSGGGGGGSVASGRSGVRAVSAMS